MTTAPRPHRTPEPTDDAPLLLRAPQRYEAARRVRSPVMIRGEWITTQRLVIAFMALQFLIPARLVIGGMGAAGRPSVAVGILLAFLWLLSALRGRLTIARQPIRWAVGIFCVVQLVGYVVGFDRLPSPGQASAADRWLILVVAFGGVALAVADGMRTRAELDRLLGALVSLTCVMSLVGVLQFFRVVDLTRHISVPGLRLNSALIVVGSRGTEEFARVAGTANHYIEYGVVLAIVLPVALHYALFAPPGLMRWMRWTAVGVIAFGIPLSISRSAVVTVFVTIGLMFVIWPWRQRYNALVITLVATSMFHVLNRGVLGTIKSLFTNASNDPSVLDRIERTATVMRLWHERPLLGWGAGMVTPEEFLLLDNQIYMFLVAGGLLGIIGFVVLLCVPYMIGRSIRLRGRDQQTRHLGHALAVTMPAALVASGTFDSFSFGTFVAVMSILIGAAGALWRLDGTTTSRPLRIADPRDAFVTSPLTADLRRRLRAGRPRAPRDVDHADSVSQPAES